jgi:hypothetical protein
VRAFLVALATCAGHLGSPVHQGLCARSSVTPGTIYGFVEDTTGRPVTTSVDLFIHHPDFQEDVHGHSDTTGYYSMTIGSASQRMTFGDNPRTRAERHIVGDRSGPVRYDVRLGTPDAPWVDPTIPDCHQP